MRSYHRWLAGLALALPVATSASPQSATVAAAPSPFSFAEVMIPMRDGARMQTVIMRPRVMTGKLPILLERTPYGVPGEALPEQYATWYKSLVDDGYIIVFQSMRGRFKSDGVFTLSTAVHPDDPNAVDEATDAYDTIDWLVKNVRDNNGKVGMWGVSYPGFAAAIALTKPHPALKAVSPQAAWIDYWQADDLHRNGALRLSYATDWLSSLQLDKMQNKAFVYPTVDTYDFFLEQGNAEAIDRNFFKGAVPMFTAMLDHPDYDGFYTAQRWSDSLGKTVVPTLNVAGFWDQEDPWGSWQIYARQKRNDPDNLAQIVAGPWNHGGWQGKGDMLGRIPLGQPSGEQFKDEIQAPFFRYWLHGKGARPVFGAKMFQSGSNRWKTYTSWPPAGARATDLYLQADHWESDDQRFVDHRPDVLSYVSAPLTEDLTVTGAIAATLMASTSGTDSDFVVKLIDVLPDDYAPNDAGSAKLGDYTRQLNGYQLPIAMEIRRGRYLASDSKPQALVPDKVLAWNFAMREHDHVFRKGHRLMVQVQSTWFPVIDRNPQRFVPNIGRAKPGDYVAATQQVCSGSRVTLPVMR